ncbi:hypothetical protein [Azospirillum palustre]
MLTVLIGAVRVVHQVLKDLAGGPVSIEAVIDRATQCAGR